MSNTRMKEKGICRIEVKGWRGYQVRVYFQGKMHTKSFSDVKCGGARAARTAAIAYRNEYEQQIGKARANRRIVTKPKANNDMPGVSVQQKRYQRVDGTTTEYREAVAFYVHKGKVHKRRFSELRHGSLERALELAREFRLAGERATKTVFTPKDEATASDVNADNGHDADDDTDADDDIDDAEDTETTASDTDGDDKKDA